MRQEDGPSNEETDVNEEEPERKRFSIRSIQTGMMKKAS
jgi:hypothetical protein